MDFLHRLTRRHFFEQTTFGLGGIALASLLDAHASAQARPAGAASQGPAAADARRFPARAKRVIFLFMAGAPSQLDLFDPKPALTKYDGQDVPAEIIQGERFAFIKGTPKLLASPFQFRRHGAVGRRDLRAAPATSRRWPTRLRSCGRCTRRSSTMRRRRSS